ncbi:MAG: hypothetical protein QM699_01955 [Amaricoccus sp.]|uniref:hypothetical protein n=1 Tax=Amaricoccus sp. TaxID=1872485 RepID=UPI0039E2FC2F
MKAAYPVAAALAAGALALACLPAAHAQQAGSASGNVGTFADFGRLQVHRRQGHLRLLLPGVPPG